MILLLRAALQFVLLKIYYDSIAIILNVGLSCHEDFDQSPATESMMRTCKMCPIEEV